MRAARLDTKMLLDALGLSLMAQLRNELTGLLHKG